MPKVRTTITLEHDVLDSMRARAAREGKSVSKVIEESLRRHLEPHDRPVQRRNAQAEHDRRMKAMDEAIRAYEAEHGVITDEEIRQTTRSLRARAIRVRPSTSERRPFRELSRSV